MKKKLSVLWEIDPLSAARLEDLALIASGREQLCGSLHPHITLGTYEDIEEDLLRQWTRAFAMSTQAFPVRFDEVGLLNPCCAVCFPAYRGGLEVHYPRFHSRLDRYADRWTSIRGGLYTPHVSLFCGAQEVDRAAQERLSRAFIPFDGRVEALALSWVKGEDEYEVLEEYALGG